jgi:anti-sigma-K factor RskA
MSAMDHSRFEELKGAFVLGALPDEERRDFEEYLASHPERQAEIEELGTVAGLLALSPEEHEPPPDLRRRIMSVVEAAEAGRPRVESRSWFARRRESLGVRGLALGAAVAMLVIGLFSWNLILQGEVQDLQGRVQSLQSQPQWPQMVALRGPGVTQGARAQVMILNNERAVLMAEELPPVPKDKTYQIWVIEDDIAKPSGLFEPKEEPIAVAVGTPLDGTEAIAVSVEPDGGSTEPTTEPLLTAKL